MSRYVAPVGKWRVRSLTGLSWISRQLPDKTEEPIVKMVTLGKHVVFQLALCGWRRPDGVFMGLQRNGLVPSSYQFFNELDKVRETLHDAHGACAGFDEVLDRIENAYRMGLL